MKTKAQEIVDRLEAAATEDYTKKSYWKDVYDHAPEGAKPWFRHTFAFSMGMMGTGGEGIPDNEINAEMEARKIRCFREMDDESWDYVLRTMKGPSACGLASVRIVMQGMPEGTKLDWEIEHKPVEFADGVVRDIPFCTHENLEEEEPERDEDGEINWDEYDGLDNVIGYEDYIAKALPPDFEGVHHYKVANGEMEYTFTWKGRLALNRHMLELKKRWEQGVSPEQTAADYMAGKIPESTLIGKQA